MLVSVDDLITRYGYKVPQDKRLIFETLLATAEQRVLAEIDYSEKTEVDYFEGTGRHYQLTRKPVREIISLSQNVDYRYDRRSGALITDEDVSDLIVTYITGYEEMPQIILSSIAYTAMHLAKLQSSGLLGVTQRTTDGGAETIEQAVLPTVVRGMLQQFKAGVLA